MKLKRSEFTTTFMMIALFAVTAALMLLSAYGAICVAWNPATTYGTYPSPPFPPGVLMWPYVIDNLMLFKISNIVTWVFTFVWGIVIYCSLTQKKAAYLLALITSAISFVFGVIPAIIADTNNFTEEFSIGSPHWGRTAANFLVFILLLLPPVRKSLQKFVSAENRMTGNVAQQIMMMSMFFFWLSLASFLGTNFMASAHVISYGVNVWQLVEIQSIGAYTTLIAGASMLGGGFILKQFNPSKSLMTSMEGNN
jgi:hypothetical protein